LAKLRFHFSNPVDQAMSRISRSADDQCKRTTVEPWNLSLSHAGSNGGFVSICVGRALQGGGQPPAAFGHEAPFACMHIRTV